jgi:hypothetical protein
VPGAVELVELAERENKPEIQRWVRREAITDYLMLVFIICRRAPVHEPDRAQQRRLLSLLDQTLKADEQEDWVRADDRFGYLVRDVATAHLAGSDQARRFAGLTALTAIHTYGEPSRPYDVRRLRFLEEFVMGILGPN